MNRDFFSWGLYVGTVAGIRIKIHWSLLIVWVIRLFLVHSEGGNILHWLPFVVISFFCILLHEFGHCLTARRVGGSANEILMWPLGGLAMCHAPNHWKAQFLVAAGGPAVTVVLILAAWGITLVAPGFSSESSNIYVRWVFYALIHWQLVLLVFNLIPLYPLDGGRMFYAGLWGFLTWRGRLFDAFGRATIATMWVSRVTAVLGIVWALAILQPFLLLLFVWAWANAEQLKRFPHQEIESADSFLGYDFSRGYTSLESGWSAEEKGKRGGFGAWVRGLFSRRRRRQPAAKESVERPPSRAAQEDSDRQRVDDLLEKISRDGMGALTEEERRFLEDVGKRWKR